MTEEHVLAVSRCHLPDCWLEETVAQTVGAEELRAVLHHAVFLPRSQAERDPRYKQLIPYILVRLPDGRFACYPRKGTETRLHGLHSVGVGGHVNPGDVGPADAPDGLLRAGARREFREEFRIPEPPTLRLCGIVNEEDTPVGHVHLGVVYVAAAPEPLPPAEELAGLRWLMPAELADVELELWSRLALLLCVHG